MKIFCAVYGHSEKERSRGLDIIKEIYAEDEIEVMPLYGDNTEGKKYTQMFEEVRLRKFDLEIDNDMVFDACMVIDGAHLNNVAIERVRPTVGNIYTQDFLPAFWHPLEYEMPFVDPSFLYCDSATFNILMMYEKYGMHEKGDMFFELNYGGTDYNVSHPWHDGRILYMFIMQMGLNNIPFNFLEYEWIDVK